MTVHMDHLKAPFSYENVIDLTDGAQSIGLFDKSRKNAPKAFLLGLITRFDRKGQKTLRQIDQIVNPAALF